jgi:hypothetical protein
LSLSKLSCAPAELAIHSAKEPNASWMPRLNIVIVLNLLLTCRVPAEEIDAHGIDEMAALSDDDASEE